MTTRKIKANGLTFAVDEAGEGQDIALCLHGFPECRYSWRHQLPALAAAGWHAVAPDLRGYGGTDTPRNQAAYHLNHLVADAAALFDALNARRRLLIAHDWGGIVAWAFAMRDPLVMDLPSIARVTKLPLERLEVLARDTPVFAPGLAYEPPIGAVAEVWDSGDLAARLSAALAVPAGAPDERDELGLERRGRLKAAGIAKLVETQASAAHV